MVIRFFSGNCCVVGARWWLHEWQSLWFCPEKLNSFNFSRFFFCDFLAVAIAALAGGWLHVWFSPRAGDATNLEKIASPSQAKNRSCSRDFRSDRMCLSFLLCILSCFCLSLFVLFYLDTDKGEARSLTHKPNWEVSKLESVLFTKFPGASRCHRRWVNCATYQ